MRLIEGGLSPSGSRAICRHWSVAVKSQSGESFEVKETVLWPLYEDVTDAREAKRSFEDVCQAFHADWPEIYVKHIVKGHAYRTFYWNRDGVLTYTTRFHGSDDKYHKGIWER